MKRKLLAFTLGVAMVFVFFGVACGGEQGGSNVDVSNEQFSRSSEDISASEEYETLLASELFPWIKTLTVESVVSVEREFAALGVAPGNFTSVNVSTEKADAQSALEYLNDLQLMKYSQGIEGGGFVALRIKTNEQTYELFSSNGECYVNGGLYTLDREILEMETEKTYQSFVTYSSTCEWCYFGERVAEYSDEDNIVPLLVFEKIDGEVAAVETPYTGYSLRFDGGELQLYDENTFWYEDKLYSIVGETNFSQYPITL